MRDNTKMATCSRITNVNNESTARFDGWIVIVVAIKSIVVLLLRLIAKG